MPHRKGQEALMMREHVMGRLDRPNKGKQQREVAVAIDPTRTRTA